MMLLASCGAATEEPVVHAASSLTDVAPLLVDGSGQDFQLNIAGSSSLAAQLVDGAPSGVFLAADEVTMRQVVDAGMASTPVVFARNRLVLVRHPTSSALGLDALADPALLVGLCAPNVPCGSLARAELAARDIEARPDTEEADVRSLLAKVVRGELDVALVYVTDALVAGDGVEIVPTDLERSTPYSAAVVGDDAPASARAFVDFLATDPARALLESAGFGPP